MSSDDSSRLRETLAELAETQKRIEAALVKLRRAEELEREAAKLREEAARDTGLTSVTSTAKVTGNMVNTHRLAISAGRRRPGDAFTAWIGDEKRETEGHKRYSMRSLAEKLEIPHSLLSMYRAKNGRKCPRDRAERIEKLTGWPADLAHWPNGLS